MTMAPGLRSVSAITAAAVIVIAAGSVSAHRLDELLQASRIAIAEEHVDLELDLTPGIAVAGAILDEIDGNDDDVLTDAEQRTYVSRVLAAVHLEADGQPLPVSLVSFILPAVDACREGNGVIKIRATAPFVSAPGSHTMRWRNEYRPEITAFLANALVPETDRIAINAQRRDGLQSELAIDYSVTNRPHQALPYAGATVLIAVLGAVARKGSSLSSAARKKR